MSRRLTFRPRARLVSTLGEELISSDTVAVIELVKNSFDADAKYVLIRFAGLLAEGGGSIEVLDDGVGMTPTVVEHAWLEPATSIKRDQVRSESKDRRLLGEKGVGRFAAARLGTQLQLVTRRAEDTRETVVDVDWTKFTSGDAYLDEIEVAFESQKAKVITADAALGTLWHAFHARRRKESGTLLRMSPLRHTWAKSDFEQLHRGLARLISPFFDRDKFQVRLEVPEPFAELSSDVQPPDLLARPRYAVKAQIDANGAAEVSLQYRNGKLITRKTSGRWLASTEDESDPPEFSKVQGDPESFRAPRCGPLQLQFRVWDRELKDLEKLANDLHLKVKDLREDLDEVAGINIYRDGFRVLPYGEPGNDWLELDRRRIQNPTLRLSNNQIVGYVIIGRDRNPELTDQSNRQGLLETPAYLDLRGILRGILAWVEAERYELREPERQRRKTKRGIFYHGELEALTQYARSELPKDKRLAGLIEKAQTRAGEADELTQETISRYRRLALLGSLVDKVIHDSSTPLSTMRSEAQLGKLDMKPKVAELNGFGELILGRFVTIDDGGLQLDHVLNHMKAFGGRKPGRPREFKLESIIEDAFDLYTTELKETGTQIQTPTTNTIVRVDPGEIKQVLVNLIDNSLYWLKRVAKEERQIKVLLRKPREGSVQIEFSDSGPGVDSEVRDRIFEPYFSTKPNGVGIGLAIAGEIVEDYYDGSLELLDRGALPGATFRITLNKRV